MKQICRTSIGGVVVLLLAFSLVQSVLAAAKDELVYVMGVEIVSLDPPGQTDNMSMTVMRHIFDMPLYGKADGTLAEGLFVKWEQSDGGRTWTFHLRKGVKFHDGTPFNAEAVKFNWDRCMATDKKVLQRSLFEPWAQNIKVIDEYTIQTTSEKPFGPILQFLAYHAGTAVVSPAALKKYGDQINRNPVGTGPFRFVEWLPGDRLVLERFDEFWGPKPRYKRLVFKFVKESGSRVMMLETGEADLILKIPPVDIERLRKNPALDVRVEPTNRVMGFYINVTAPLVNDLRFRRALAYAIDRNSLLTHVMKGFGRPVCSAIGGGTFGEATPECYEYNPQKAKELLKEAGYKGESLQLWTPQGRYEMDRETAEAAQAYWGQVGINVDFQVMEFASLQRGITLPPDKVKYQIAFLGTNPDSMDADQIIRSRYHSNQIPPDGVNRSRYSNRELDALIDAQAVEPNVEKRKELLKNCQEIIARDLPFIPLYIINQAVGTRKNLKGVDILPNEYSIVREAYFQE